MRAYKKLFNTKMYHINKIGKRQHYLILNRVKAKLYVSKTYRLRDLIMELYTLPSLNGCAGIPSMGKQNERRGSGFSEAELSKVFCANWICPSNYISRLGKCLYLTC